MHSPRLVSIRCGSNLSSFTALTRALRVLGQIFKNEGPMAFYKGFVPNFVRLGSWVTVMFVSYEQIKANFWTHLN